MGQKGGLPRKGAAEGRTVAAQPYVWKSTLKMAGAGRAFRENLASVQEIRLDIKDRKILYQLDLNARQPVPRIAKKVGLSKEVTNYRINRLLQQGVIRGFYARIDTSKLGMTLFRTFIRMQNLAPGKEREFIEYISSNPSIGFFVRVEGRFDFNFIYWARTSAEYVEFWNGLKAAFGRHIENKELHILHYYANFPKAFLIGKKDMAVEFFECGLGTEAETDALDLQILNILAKEARLPLIEIAQRLGVSDKVAGYRIRKLEKAGIIHSYGVQLGLDKAGLHYYKLHIFFQNYSKQRFKELKNFAIGHPNVVFIDECLGGPDFELELYMPSKDDYYAFLQELRFRFSDIIRDFETIYYPQEFKLVLFPWKPERP